LNRDLDEIDWCVLRELQADARLSYSELGRRVGLSPPAVTERVRRLEETGVIAGYRAVVDPEGVGLPITAFVRSRISGNDDTVSEIVALAAAAPEVLECHRITGDDCYLMKVAVRSVADLERVLARFVAFGPTTTSIVLSSPVTSKVIAPVTTHASA
jgi:Lrp/AsnC family leucine-responsive transcriptional regulator